MSFLFFFFNDTATTEIYTLSLHDALPISGGTPVDGFVRVAKSGYITTYAYPSRPLAANDTTNVLVITTTDRKSTRLNSSHLVISYAVFCLKKKKKAKENKSS